VYRGFYNKVRDLRIGASYCMLETATKESLSGGLGMSQKPASKVWDEFIAANMSLSGLTFDDGEDGKEEADRHRLLADVLFAKPAKFVHPVIINSTLMGHQRKKLRRGTEWRLIGQVPPADCLEIYIEDWTKRIGRGLSLIKNAPMESRGEFCWRAHDEFRCMHPFEGCNGITGRFILNHLRRLLDMQILILNEANAGEYHRRLDLYCEHLFLPRLPGVMERLRKNQPHLP